MSPSTRLAMIATVLCVVSGCVNPVCGPKNSWLAKWDNPGLLDHLPRGNGSHPEWRVEELVGGRGYSANRTEYAIHLSVYGGEGHTRFSVAPFFEKPTPSREQAHEEWEKTVEDFSIEAYVTTMQPNFEKASTCG